MERSNHGTDFVVFFIRCSFTRCPLLISIRINAPLMKKDKIMPDHATEEEERAFWATHDSTDFVDWDNAEAVVLPHLKPTTKSISLRLPESMLNQLRLLANKRDIPYQSLIKLFLSERIEQELRPR